MMLKRLLFSSLVLLLLSPILQRWFHIFTLPPLQGDFVNPAKPVPSRKAWYHGEYQDQYSKYLEPTIGFHDLLVRINNQFDFNCFRKGNTNDVVIGKEDIILGSEYIRSYLGGDFIGEKAVDKKLRRLKFLQEHLRKLGKDLVIVFEPGKVSYYPEKIPPRYSIKFPKRRNNYQAFTERARQLGVDFIDFNQWFVSMKKSTAYPLYSRNGIHWTEYGAWLAADSLVKYIEKKRNIDLPEVVADSIPVSAVIRGSDYDAANTLNLLFRLKSFPLPYPVLSFPPGVNKQKVSVLTVADSYYWNIYNTKIASNLYNDESFWYFNALVYPESYKALTYTDSLDIIQEAEKRDIIFMMVTECWMAKFDFSFIDKLFDAYTPELEPDYPYLYEGKIRSYTEWMTLVADKAIKNHEKLEVTLSKDAKFTFKNELKEQYLVRYGPEYYKESIESDAQWLEKEKIKAAEEKTMLVNILYRDSWYLFRQEYPGLCRQYFETLQYAGEIKNDTAAMKKIMNNPWYLRPEEMLWQVARAKAKGGPQSLALMTW
jgi:hypothetical protein